MIIKFVVLLISFYQIFISPLLRLVIGAPNICRYEESCSAYSKRMILEKGIIFGIVLGFKRILSCNPLNSKKVLFLTKKKYNTKNGNI